MALSVDHPFIVILMIIASLVACLFAIGLVVGIIECFSCYTRKIKTKRAKWLEQDTEKAHNTALKKAVNARLAEFQRRRDLVATRADGWHEAHAAMKMEQLHLEDEAVAGRKVLQDLEAVLIRDEVARH